jgi:hypothetical protein
MITADTITDEQIRELRDEHINRHLVTRFPIPTHAAATIDCCDLALGLIARADTLGLMQRTEARARCAELLNAHWDWGRAPLPTFCGMDARSAEELDEDTLAEELHLLGNGCVPAQAAVAFTLLWERLHGTALAPDDGATK